MCVATLKKDIYPARDVVRTYISRNICPHYVLLRFLPLITLIADLEVFTFKVKFGNMMGEKRHFVTRVQERVNSMQKVNTSRGGRRRADKKIRFRTEAHSNGCGRQEDVPSLLIWDTATAPLFSLPIFFSSTPL